MAGIKLIKEWALQAARSAVDNSDIRVSADSLGALYELRKHGLGEQNRGSAIVAKLAFGGDWDRSAVDSDVSDPHGANIIPPLF